MTMRRGMPARISITVTEPSPSSAQPVHQPKPIPRAVREDRGQASDHRGAGSPTARPVQPIAAVAPLTKDIALNGQVTQVDAQNRLVQISIGTAAGVRQDMKFHVTRGDHYVADILIIEVWPDQGGRHPGSSSKQGMQPQAGDKVSTNL